MCVRLYQTFTFNLTLTGRFASKFRVFSFCSTPPPLTILSLIIFVKFQVWPQSRPSSGIRKSVSWDFTSMHRYFLFIINFYALIVFSSFIFLSLLVYIFSWKYVVTCVPSIAASSRITSVISGVVGVQCFSFCACLIVPGVLVFLLL